jgi:predicted molibdopterin-dependent oxidoreductase YjgC
VEAIMTMTGTAAADEKQTKTISLTINGTKAEVPEGLTVLEAAHRVGIYIPTLCYTPDLKPYGGCRLCIVEIDKMRGLPTACTTPATEGMNVTTESSAINEVRRATLELILTTHPCECLVCHRRRRCGPYDICLRQVSVTDRCVTCPANGQCELQKVVDHLGVHELNLPQDTTPRPIDTSNPFFEINHNRCILCARCIRTCQEITCVDAIEMAYRGYKMKVSTFGDGALVNSNCRSCGECMVHCPVGAMIPRETARPEREVKTICPYCGVGCSLYLGVKDGRITGVRGDPRGGANRGRLCVKGRFGIAEFVNHDNRLKTPLIRKKGRLQEATWEEALDLVAKRLGKYHGDEVAVVSSAKTTNEDNYVMQKLARVVLGTNNVDHCARL